MSYGCQFDCKMQEIPKIVPSYHWLVYCSPLEMLINLSLSLSIVDPAGERNQPWNALGKVDIYPKRSRARLDCVFQVPWSWIPRPPAQSAGGRFDFVCAYLASINCFLQREAHTSTYSMITDRKEERSRWLKHIRLHLDSSMRRVYRQGLSLHSGSLLNGMRVEIWMLMDNTGWYNDPTSTVEAANFFILASVEQ